MKPLQSLVRLVLVALGLLAGVPGRLLAQGPAQPFPHWAGAVQNGGTGQDGIQAAVTDGAGNVYLTGTCEGLAIFGADTVRSTPSILYNTAFVAKRSARGAWRWATSVTNCARADGIALALDRQGHLVLGCTVAAPSATFGTTTVPSQGSQNLVVAQLDTATGAWGNHFVAAGPGAALSGLTVDASGDVTVAGFYESNVGIYFGLTRLTPTPYPLSDLFVAKCRPATGQWLWAVRSSTTSPNTQALALAADAATGDVFVAGRYRQGATLGTTVLPNAGSQPNVFLARVAGSTGAYLWATAAGGSGDDQGLALVRNAAGQLVVGGYFASASIQFGPSALANAHPNGSSDGFVARASPAGQWLGAVRMGGPGDDQCTALHASPTGDTLYAGGHFAAPIGMSATLTLGPDVLSVGSISSNAWLSALVNNTWRWGRQSQGDGEEYLNTLALDARRGLLYAGGIFRGQLVAGNTFAAGRASFGRDTLTSAPTRVGPSEGFLARLALRTDPRPLAAAAARPAPQALLLAPNPATEYVQLTGGTAPTVTLCNMLGQACGPVATVTNGRATIGLHGLPPGLYLLRCGHQVRHLLVQ